jgi:hypothetical protein
VRGVVYQEHSFADPIDPITDDRLPELERDIALFAELGINTILVCKLVFEKLLGHIHIVRRSDRQFQRSHGSYEKSCKSRHIRSNCKFLYILVFAHHLLHLLVVIQAINVSRKLIRRNMRSIDFIRINRTSLRMCIHTSAL